jgi:hypothetical protein
MEDDPLIKLTEYFKSNGYDPREAVEKAEVELERRRQHESKGKIYLNLIIVPHSKF